MQVKESRSELEMVGMILDRVGVNWSRLERMEELLNDYKRVGLDLKDSGSYC